jgi:hypothetical protein
MDERKAGRIVGTLLADLVFFCVVGGIGVLSLNLASKLLRIAITREAMKSANPTNDYPETDLE